MKEYRLHAIRDWSFSSEYLIMNPSALATETFFYVQEMGHFFTRQSYFTERENLNSFLIAYTVSGKGYLQFQGKMYTLVPGQAFFINCEEYQCYFTDRKDLWEFSWVHFNGATSRSYWEFFMKSGGPVCTVNQNTTIPHILNELLTCCSQKNEFSEVIASKLLVDILTEMMQYKTGERLRLPSRNVPAFIRNVQKTLDERYQEPITLDKLASEVALNKFHLLREFRKYVGFTPIQYVTNIRMNAAKRLLTSSTLSIAEVAAQVGFDNVSHFIKVFKRQEHITPLVFRKKWNSLR